MPQPDLLTMLQRLIAEPSVSSVSAEWDQSNARVVDTLAQWCEDAGLRVEKQAIPQRPGKFNLIASAGSGFGFSFDGRRGIHAYPAGAPG